jgi:hypothetical protein
MSVSSVNTLYPFASYAPAGANEPAPQVARGPEPGEGEPAPQTQTQSAPAPAERSEEPKKASSGPGQVVDRKV